MMSAATSGLAQERWQSGPPADPYRQQPNPYQQQQPAPPPDAGSELRRNLQSVGSNPNNVTALIDSGRAALAMGDAQAALTFFSRADEVAPREPRIKAGMASAMTLLGQPRPALALFAEAHGLGAPELEIAADRGLAHDLNGDPRAAQRDYALVLRRRDSDETRRRLALSLAISGQREPALRLLEPQIRRGDRAGWRTQAFVLALTGDAAGAARVASGTGPVGTAEAMAPFLGRLPALSPAQRAMAVHLGVFPSDGRVQIAANVDTTPDPGALALAGGPARPPAPAAVAQQQARVAERPGLRRTREGAASPVERGAVRAPERERPRSFAERREGTYRIPGPNFPATTVRRVPAQPAAPQPVPEQNLAPQQTPALPATRFAPPPEEPVAPPVDQEPPPAATQQQVPPAPAEQAAPPPPPPPPSAEQQQPAVDAAILAGVRPGDMIAAPGFSLTPSPAPATPPSMLSERSNSALGDIAMVVNALPPDQGQAGPAPAAQAPPVERRAPPPPQPSTGRHWVQVAGNIDRSSMADELRRLRGRAPTLLNGMQGWTARTGATGRLLVGPFGSPRDAQAFVNQLRPRGIEAVAWSSAAGQTVERLSVPAGSAQAGRATPQRRPGASGARSESQQAAARSPRSTRGRNEESRASTTSRGGRNRGEDARVTTATRGARGRTEEARTAANSRDTRRRGEETRAGATSRNARSRTEPARAGGNARNSRTATAETRSNRGGSTVERRANDRDARPSRSRSPPEQRPSARGRRSD
jgi:tetratricopeptide (TPR) repeat protein